MKVINHTFWSIGDVAEPLVGESIWDWDHRTKHYSPNLRDAGDMLRMFHSAKMEPGKMNTIRESLDWMSNEDSNPNILVWGDTVFFSSENDMAVFKLSYHDFIDVVTIMERKTFKYVNR